MPKILHYYKEELINITMFDEQKTNLESVNLDEKVTKLLPKAAKNLLMNWLKTNCFKPYPSVEEKMDLALKANLSVRQVTNWLVNARRRILPKLLGGPAKITKLIESYRDDSVVRPSNGKETRLLPKAAKKFLKNWFESNRLNSYTTVEEKENLALKTNLSVMQINNWLINARRRILPNLLTKKFKMNKTKQNATSKNVRHFKRKSKKSRKPIKPFQTKTVTTPKIIDESFSGKCTNPSSTIRKSLGNILNNTWVKVSLSSLTAKNEIFESDFFQFEPSNEIELSFESLKPSGEVLPTEILETSSYFELGNALSSSLFTTSEINEDISLEEFTDHSLYDFERSYELDHLDQLEPLYEFIAPYGEVDVTADL